MNLKLRVDPLADFDVDVGDTLFKEKFMAYMGHDETVVTIERSGDYPDQEDRDEPPFPPNVERVDTVPLQTHPIQKDADLGTQIAFPDLHEWVTGGVVEPLQLY